MRDHRIPSNGVGHLDGVQCLCKGPDLVQLDEDRIGGLFFDPLGNPLGVGDKEVVSHNLDAAPQFCGHLGPVLPVVFSEAVFNGINGEAIDPVLIELDHLHAIVHGLIRFLKHIVSLFVEFG